jgi:hypothetical protein
MLFRLEWIGKLNVAIATKKVEPNMITNVEVIANTEKFVECRFVDSTHNVLTIMTIEKLGAKRILFKDYLSELSYKARADLVRWWVTIGCDKAQMLDVEHEEDLQPTSIRHCYVPNNCDDHPLLRRIRDKYVRNVPTWPRRLGVTSPTMQRLAEVFA